MILTLELNTYGDTLSLILYDGYRNYYKATG